MTIFVKKGALIVCAIVFLRLHEAARLYAILPDSVVMQGHSAIVVLPNNTASAYKRVVQVTTCPELGILNNPN